MGLLPGLIYLRTGRNLAVPIIAHGIQDSINFVLIFFGKYSGIHAVLFWISGVEHQQ